MDLRHKCSLSTDPSTLLSTETGPGWAPSSMRVLWNWDVGYNRCWEKDNLFPSAVIKTKDHVSPDLLLAIFYTLKKASLRIKPIQKKAEARGWEWESWWRPWAHESSLNWSPIHTWGLQTQTPGRILSQPEAFLPRTPSLRACQCTQSALYSRSQQTFSVNGQIVNVSGSVGCQVFAATTRLCCWSREIAMDSMWANEQSCVPAKLYLQKQVGRTDFALCL